MRIPVLLLSALILSGGSAASADRQDIDTCRLSNDTDRKIESCTRLIGDPALAPETRGLALLSRGLAHESSGDSKGAMADYNEAIRTDPRSANAYMVHASLYRSASDHDRAIADLDEYLKVAPTSYGGFALRANCYRDKGDIDLVIADYNEAIRLKPDFSFAYHDRGVAYRLKGDRDHAIADFREAIRLGPATAGPSRDALAALGAGEPKAQTATSGRGMLDLQK